MVQNEATRVHGIVLAGTYPGHCALDQLVPRPLLPVAQQPLISFSLRWMKAGGLRAATICANSAARSIRTRLDGSRFGMRVRFHEDWSPRGAAGCVRDAGMQTRAETFVVADGTAVPVVDLEELLLAHRSSSSSVTVVVGSDATGRMLPTGVYVFDRGVLDFIPEDGFQDIKEKLVPRLYAEGRPVSTHMARAVAPRVISTETYLALNQWAVERVAMLVDAQDGFRVCDEAVVHESATVHPGARLLGPVLLGPRVSVQAGGTLVGPVSLGPGTTVGAGATVTRSVVWGGCTVGDGAFVDRSLLAEGVRVEAGRSVFTEVLQGRRRERPLSRPGRSVEALWGPIASVLRPATPHQL